jgi:hypothetical protein
LAIVHVVANNVSSGYLLFFNAFNLELDILSSRSIRHTDITWIVDLFDLE